MNTIQNPILPGFAPDASALHVGKDYYIATSTFLNGGPALRFTIPKIWSTGSGPLRHCPARYGPRVSCLAAYNSGSLWAPHLSLRGRAVLAGFIPMSKARLPLRTP